MGCLNDSIQGTVALKCVVGRTDTVSKKEKTKKFLEVDGRPYNDVTGLKLYQERTLKDFTTDSLDHLVEAIVVLSALPNGMFEYCIVGHFQEV